MASPPLEDIDIALNNQISRGLTLQDTVDTEHSFASAMLGMDAFYGVKNRRFTDVPLKGRKAQVNFRTSLPVVQGVDAMAQNFESIKLPLEKNFSIKAGEMGYSAYQFGEGVRKFEVNRLEGDAAIAGYVIEASQACTDAVIKKWSADWFPINTMSPTEAGGADGQQRSDKMLSIGYPLQSGYADNASTGSGSYYYLGIDLNLSAFSGIKAVFSGNETTGFGQPTPQNIRRNLLMPCRNRGGRPDLMICDSKTYDFLLDFYEDSYLTTPAKIAEFGGTFVKPLGLTVMVEQRLDDLDAAGEHRAMYILDTRTWAMGVDGSIKDFKFFKDLELRPAHSLIQGYIECLTICKNPRYNCAAWDVTD